MGRGPSIEGRKNAADAQKAKLFTKLRDEKPEMRFLAPLYRSPICVSAAGANKGAVVSFRF